MALPLHQVCYLPSVCSQVPHVSPKHHVIYWKLKDELAIDQEKPRLRSFSHSNNYHAILHRQGSVFFSFLLRADKLKIPGFGEDILNITRKKKKWKWSSVTALAWHICSGNVRVYSADDSRITNKTWAIRLLSPYGLSLALACSGHVAHPKYVLKWVVSVSVHESG